MDRRSRTGIKETQEQRETGLSGHPSGHRDQHEDLGPSEVQRHPRIVRSVRDESMNHWGRPETLRGRARAAARPGHHTRSDESHSARVNPTGGAVCVSAQRNPGSPRSNHTQPLSESLSDACAGLGTLGVGGSRMIGQDPECGEEWLWAEGKTWRSSKTRKSCTQKCSADRAGNRATDPSISGRQDLDSCCSSRELRNHKRTTGRVSQQRANTAL